MRLLQLMEGMNRRMFVAASAAFLGGIADVTGTVVAGDGDSLQPAVAPKHSPWPHHSPTTPFVNAADFGLKPCLPDKMKTEDFAANPDATDALQQALDAGANGHVFIPPGAYRVTRPLTLQSGTKLTGAGFCSTMIMTEKAIPAILHARVSGPMTVISDLWVSGPVGGNWHAAGIWLDGCNGITVHDCWVGALQTGLASTAFPTPGCATSRSNSTNMALRWPARSSGLPLATCGSSIAMAIRIIRRELPSATAGASNCMGAVRQAVPMPYRPTAAPK